MKSRALLLAVLVPAAPLAAVSPDAIEPRHGTARAVLAVPQPVSPQAPPSAGPIRRRLHPDMLPLPQMPAPLEAVPLEPREATSPGLPPLPLSPAPSASFQALGDDNTSIPPDTQGAVSATQLLVAANTQVRVQSRTGTDQGTYSLSSFFGTASGGSGVFDPVVQYDPYANRFIFVATDDAASAASGVLVAVSATSSASGTYYVWRFDPDSGTSYWADRPQVGFNATWVAVQINLYKVSDNSFVRSLIYALPKAGLYAGGTISYSYFNLDPSYGGGQVPAQTLDSALGTLYFVQRWNGNSGGQGYVRVYAMTGSVGAENFTPVGYATTSSTWAYGGGSDFAPQSGSSHLIDTGDDRMLSVLYRGGSIWAAHNVFLPASGATRSAVQWWQLGTSASVMQRGRIDDSSGALFAAYPSIAVNKDGAALIGYSTFSASQYASAAYALHGAADAAGATQSPVTFKSGEASYYKVFGGTANRWGDYSATVVDPADDTNFWTIQEYASTPSGGSSRFGMWWAKVPPSASTSSSCTADATTLCLVSGRFKVQADYRDYGGNTGSGNAVSLTGDSGYFWFFSSSNVELVAKMVSFCSGSSGNFGIYASGLTDVEVTFKVTDTKYGTYREYHNNLGNRFCTIADGPFSCP